MLAVKAVPNGDNDGGEIPESLAVKRLGMRNMIEILRIIAALSLVALMAGRKKKEPVFGQLTLSSELALEYLKSSMDGFSRNVSKVIWITPLEAQAKGYSIPDWVVQNFEKFEWSAIVFDENTNILPLFVYQKSALQKLESKLADFESDGAKITQVSPREMVVEFGDRGCSMRFWRNEKGGKFAQYYLEVDETQ